MIENCVYIAVKVGNVGWMFLQSRMCWGARKMGTCIQLQIYYPTHLSRIKMKSSAVNSSLLPLSMSNHNGKIQCSSTQVILKRTNNKKNE